MNKGIYLCKYSATWCRYGTWERLFSPRNNHVFNEHEAAAKVTAAETASEASDELHATLNNDNAGELLVDTAVSCDGTC